MLSSGGKILVPFDIFWVLVFSVSQLQQIYAYTGCPALQWVLMYVALFIITLLYHAENFYVLYVCVISAVSGMLVFNDPLGAYISYKNQPNEIVPWSDGTALGKSKMK